MKLYTIYPLVTLITDNNEMSMQTLGQNFGIKNKAVVIMWLIQGNGVNVLVDSGQSDAAETIKNHQPAVQTEEMLPLNALRAKGVEPKDIDAIILTHLHWDHCYNLELFPDTTPIYVQKKEVAYAINPLPVQQKGYESPQTGMTPPWLPHLGRMHIIEGDLELYEGIKAWFLPGHSPGMMGVTVNTSGGVYLIASDNIPLYLNWEKKIPSAWHVNLEEYYASFRRMEQICDHVLPAHDMKLLEYKQFPEQ